MKDYYELRTRFFLPRRTYTIIRIDGKSFHSYTRSCKRPYDLELMDDMDSTATALCRSIDSVRLAYVQSDEISLLLTDFDSIKSEAWFNGNLQKMVSISASIASVQFNNARYKRHLSMDDYSKKFDPDKIDNAYFDSRAFTISNLNEVENYFIWRGQDCTRNSISMTAHTYINHNRLQGKSSDEMQEMLWQECSINWNDMPDGFKRGRCIVKQPFSYSTEYVDNRTGQSMKSPVVDRMKWVKVVPPVFTQNREWLRSHIPKGL